MLFFKPFKIALVLAQDDGMLCMGVRSDRCTLYVWASRGWIGRRLRAAITGKSLRRTYKIGGFMDQVNEMLGLP